MRDLAETWFRALTALVRHAAQPGAGGRTPSDLALVDLTQGEIERLESEYPKIEDILPLSPLQEGLLFHALYDAQGPDVYTVQLELELEGPLDAAVLEASLQAVVARHASLRAGFRHERLSRPVQVVVARAAVPWRLIDLSGQDAAGQQRELSSDRRSRPPGAVRSGGAAADAVCADPACGGPASAADQQPSPLMDGWSAPILVRELLEVYARRGSAASLPRVTPYRDYLALIARQDRAAGLAAWREALAGLEEGTRLAPRQAGREPLAPEQIVLSLDAALSASLNRDRARAGADAEHRDAGRVGHAARPAERPRRRGVRRDGGGPSGGACRRRAHGGAVHQHAAAAAAAAAGAAAVGAAAADPGQPVAADGASASGAGRDPAGGRGRRAVRHAAGVRELSGRPRRACGGGPGATGIG